MHCPECGHHMDQKFEDGYEWYECPECHYQEPPVKVGHDN